MTKEPVKEILKEDILQKDEVMRKSENHRSTLQIKCKYHKSRDLQ